jgi:hypothetical protein
MTNIEYEEGNKGTLKWNCNYKAIYENLKNIMGFEKLGEYKGEVLVIYGEKSRTIDIEEYKNIFPNINEEDFKKIFLAGTNKIIIKDTLCTWKDLIRSPLKSLNS